MATSSLLSDLVINSAYFQSAQSVYSRNSIFSVSSSNGGYVPANLISTTRENGTGCKAAAEFHNRLQRCPSGWREERGPVKWRATGENHVLATWHIQYRRLQSAEPKADEDFRGLKILRTGSTGAAKQMSMMAGAGETTPDEEQEDALIPWEEESEYEEEEYEEDDEDDEEWGPLVVCVGEAIDEFMPSIRRSKEQMDHDNLMSWRCLQAAPPEFARAPGGPSSNMAIALARQKARVAFVGRLGDDEAGSKMLDLLNSNGVQTNGVKISTGALSQVATVNVKKEGDKWSMQVVSDSAGNSFLKREVKTELLHEAALIHLTSLSLLSKVLCSTLYAVLEYVKPLETLVMFDPNLPLPLWQSSEVAWRHLEPVWQACNIIEVSKQELEFLLGEEMYIALKLEQGYYASETYEGVLDQRRGRNEYHYEPEELLPLLHDNLQLLLVTDGTFRVHYYTPEFHGSVQGTEDILLAPFTMDRSGSGDAVVAGFIRRLTANPGILENQDLLERALRFAISAGVIAQWTNGSVRGLPTESATQNLMEQVYIPALL